MLLWEKSGLIVRAWCNTSRRWCQPRLPQRQQNPLLKGNDQQKSCDPSSTWDQQLYFLGTSASVAGSIKGLCSGSPVQAQQAALGLDKARQPDGSLRISSGPCTFLPFVSGSPCASAQVCVVAFAGTSTEPRLGWRAGRMQHFPEHF